tara:strand:- start:3040 stop:3393 length:354 start_codon:yes stop_codon:yes gene_type:complete
MKLENKFKIFDCQQGHYAFSGQWFTEKEAIDQLASFHDVDFDNEEYKDIRAWLDTEKTQQDKLYTLLGYGDWDIHEVIYHDTKTDTITGGDYYNIGIIKETLSNNPTYEAETRLYLE